MGTSAFQEGRIRGKTDGITRFALADGLESFPERILEHADTLEVLDLSGNHLKRLPDGFARLRKLKIAFFSGNEFVSFPEVLGECPDLEMVGFKSNRIAHMSGDAVPPRLRWLILTDNRLESLPEELGRGSRLQKLMLSGNRLVRLPEELASCGNLELLRLASNRLDCLPGWLWTLPRLSWLAASGNPCCALPSFPDGPRVPWADLAFGETLGEGASGVISKARWGERDVAVKIFKGELTSDGLPGHERAACLAAGVHENIIPVHGELEGHPEGKDGLVLGLVDPRFGNLGAPPSLESCTRDVFSPKMRLPPEVIARIARGIAAAVEQLHRRGIAHGDIYAHNILVDGAGNALLGDFGAATFLQGLSADESDGFRRIESRAFGCLLDDLLGLARIESRETDLLILMRDRCLADHPAHRPLFDEILRELT